MNTHERMASLDRANSVVLAEAATRADAGEARDSEATAPLRPLNGVVLDALPALTNGT